MSKTIGHVTVKSVGGDCFTAVQATVILAIQKEVAKEMNKVAEAGQKRGA